MIIGLAGLGRVGLKSLRILRRYRVADEIIVFDRDPVKRDLIRDLDNVYFARVDDVEDVLRDVYRLDLLMISLPSREAYRLLTRVASKCIDIVDVSYQQTDPYIFERYFTDCGKMYIPDAGYAPGYSNLLAGFAQSMLGSIDSLEIYVGGIPVRKIPPIGYTVTWSAEDLLEEYMRPARVVRDGRVVEADPLENTGSIEIRGLGVFEWFYSDGLRTMIRNIKARNMFEATLRWPDHIKAIKLLRDLGFLSRDKITVGREEIEIYRVVAEILERKLRIETEDMAILLVRARGDDEKSFEELVVVRGDTRDSATIRFTAIVFTSTALLLLREKERIETGVQPLEKLYQYKEYYEKLLIENQPDRDKILIHRSYS
ncbi:MAG: saccharopine dehydrogenase C-terminal domain-containing protein [Sulfolobales archaeon]